MEDNMNNLEDIQGLSNEYKAEFVNNDYGFGTTEETKEVENNDNIAEEGPVHNIDVIDKDELYSRLGIESDDKKEENDEVEQTTQEIDDLGLEEENDKVEQTTQEVDDLSLEEEKEEPDFTLEDDIKEDYVPVEDVVEEVKEDYVPVETEEDDLDLSMDATTQPLDDTKETVDDKKNEPEKFIEIKINKEVAVKAIEKASDLLKEQAKKFKVQLAALALGTVFGMGVVTGAKMEAMDEKPAVEVTTEVDQEISQDNDNSVELLAEQEKELVVENIEVDKSVEPISEVDPTLTPVPDDRIVGKDEKQELIFQDITSDQNYNGNDLPDPPALHDELDLEEGRSR